MYPLLDSFVTNNGSTASKELVDETPIPVSKKQQKPAPMATPKPTAKATSKTVPKLTKQPVNDDPTESEGESLSSKKLQAQKIAKRHIVMTDGDSTAKSNIETPQPLCKKVKKVKQVVEEKAGRKKKECVCDGIEGVQKAAVSKGKDRVMGSSPTSKPKRFGDGPQLLRSGPTRLARTISGCRQRGRGGPTSSPC
jgi:hypothetical protein